VTEFPACFWRSSVHMRRRTPSTWARRFPQRLGCPRRIITDELGLGDVRLRTTGGVRGWLGDSPLVHLDTTRIKALGWRPTIPIPDSIRATVRYLAEHPRSSRRARGGSPVGGLRIDPIPGNSNEPKAPPNARLHRRPGLQGRRERPRVSCGGSFRSWSK
jgi:hypothetical protein